MVRSVDAFRRNAFSEPTQAICRDEAASGLREPEEELTLIPRRRGKGHTHSSNLALAVGSPDPNRQISRQRFAGAIKDNIYPLRGGRRIYTTPWVDGQPIRPCSASILLTAWGRPFDLTVPGSTQICRAVALRPMTPRALHGGNIGVVAFQFDPSHADFPRFRRLTTGALTLDRDRFARFNASLEAACRGELTNEAASELFNNVAALAVPSFPRTRPLDGRITKAIELLRENHKYPLAELAAAVGISYYRLSHLFAENIGISLRTYQRWRKVRKAISLSKHGYTLTKIAHDAGFTDSSHFTRAFQQLYAAPPSYYFHSGKVRIVAPRRESKSDEASQDRVDTN